MESPPGRRRVRSNTSPPPGMAQVVRLLRLEGAPLDLRILGRTLLHAAVVGAAAGLFGALFFAALEWGQHVALETLTGYSPARARGEGFLPADVGATVRIGALAVLPAVGALLSGVLTSWLAPEAAGGGGDAIIESFHRGAVIRRRLIFVKAAAAVATLGAGGSGGREGPTMHIGGALGAWVARSLATTPRERRILLIAGVAAGISAVFRTPLGAALLATEMPYRDDFESDALVPAILASVISYSIAISIVGHTPLFGRLPPMTFVPAHLVLYVALALVVALAAVSFIVTLRTVQRGAAHLPLPVWARPAVGGLAVGLFGSGVLLALTRNFGDTTGRLGVFGGGYGVAQIALASGDALPSGWALVALLAALGLAKMVATALTIGTGGTAGDFAPSLVMGALIGGAFGRAAALLVGDPRIDPAAFALVGMGTFYGGVAHVPLSALVIVCELAGSYDLLVPMMLAISTAYIALRHWSLYPAQRRSRASSRFVPEPGTAGIEAVLRIRAREALVPVEVGPVAEGAPIRDIVNASRRMHRQKVLTVNGSDMNARGLVDASSLAGLDSQEMGWIVAADVMGPYGSASPDADLTEVAAALQRTGMPQIPIAVEGEVIGYVGENEIARALARAPEGAPEAS